MSVSPSYTGLPLAIMLLLVIVKAKFTSMKLERLVHLMAYCVGVHTVLISIAGTLFSST